MMPKIVVIGSSYIDITVRCNKIPSPGRHSKGSALSYIVNGAGPNQAVEAALCGCQVHLITKVGGDIFEQMLKKKLIDYHVNTDFVYTAQAKNTGALVTFVNQMGENAEVSYVGANSAFSANEIDQAEEIISQADICLIHGKLPQEAIIQAIRLSAIHNTKIILNPARPLKQNDLPAEYFNADILIPDLYQAANITDHSEANIRHAKVIGSELVAQGVSCAVITMGKKGCMVVDRQGAKHLGAFEIDLVDQTCTGDAFAGALAAYCAVKFDISQAVNFAGAAGALACTKFGAIESLPKKAEIIELLQKQELG